MEEPKAAGLDLGALLGAMGGEEGGGVDFASLVGMLGGLGGSPGGGREERGREPRDPLPGREAPGPDPALLSTLSRAMAALREPDRNIRLLRALRPYLEPERQRKVDEAVKILHLMKLAPLLQESGLRSGLLGREEE